MKQLFSLEGKVALVTGGSRGIGKMIARGLLEYGAKVYISSRKAAACEEACRELSAFGDCVALPADLSRMDEIGRFTAELAAREPKLHILVNNVGGGGRWGEEVVEETELRVWSEVYEKNAMAAVRFTRRALTLMRRAKWGRVVTITSIFGGNEGGGRPWFTMAKAAE